MAETIHSGQFMSTRVHSAAPEEVEEEECEGDMQAADVNPEDQSAVEKPVTFYKFTLENTRSVDIEFSLAKLYHCVELAYKGIATPKWKKFSGMKIEWKDRIRLNNVIWRAWHMQFIHRLKPKFCYFSLPEEDQHRKPEATLVEGMYWKRRYETVGAEYNRWRHYFYKRNHHTITQREKKTGKVQRGDSLDDAVILPYPSDFSNLEDDEWGNWVTDHLFSSLNQPYMFPNPKEMAQAGNADFIQPGLVQLQPSMEEILANLGYVTEANSPCFADGQKEFGKGYGAGGSPSVYDFSTSLRDTQDNSNFVDGPIKLLQQQVAQPPMAPYNSTPITESNGSTYINLLPPPQPTGNPSYAAGVAVRPVLKTRNVPIAPKKRIHFISKEMGMCDDSYVPGPLARHASGPVDITTPAALTPRVEDLQYTSSPTGSTNLPSATLHHLPPVVVESSHIQCVPSQPVTGPYLQVDTRPPYPASNSGSPFGRNKSLASSSRPTGTQQRPPLIAPQIHQESYRPRKTMKSEVDYYQAVDKTGVQQNLGDTKSSGSSAVAQFQPTSMGLCGSAVDIKRPSQGKQSHHEQLFVSASGAQTSSVSQTRNSSIVRPVPINLLSPVRSDSSAFSSISPCSNGSSPMSPSHVRSASSVQDYITHNSGNNSMTVFNASNASNFVQVMQSQPSTSHSAPPQQFLIYQPFTNLPVMTMSCSYPAVDAKVSSPAQEDQKLPLHRYNAADYVNQARSSQDTSSRKEQPLTPGIKRSLKRAADSTVDASEKKRLQHLMSEHSRRSALKTGFEQLESMLPNITQEGNKVTNALVLMRAAQYIRSLKQGTTSTEQQIQSLKTEAAELNNKISAYQNHLPTGKSANQGGNLVDLYKQYVKAQTADNWKFWLQAELMKPLFESFCAEVEGSTAEELKKSAAEWSTKNGNLRTLRPSLSKVLLDLATETQVLSNAQCLEAFSLNQAEQL